MTSVDVKCLQKFISRVRGVNQSSGREIRLTIEEANDLCLTIAQLLVEDSETLPMVVEVKGGSF